MVTFQAMDARDPKQAEADREVAEWFAAAYDENGVDRSLIRHSLSLTPEQRMQANQDVLDMMATVRSKTNGAR
ncbi:MAG: hypothetical protein ACHREM_24730 [Polyangiales bacterium]